MLRSMILVAGQSFRSWFATPRCLILFMVIFLLLWGAVAPLGQMVEMTGYRVLPAIFPFIAADPLYQLVFMAGLVFLLADAPFLSEYELYVLQRTGRVVWVLGKVLYVLLATFVYFIVLILITTLIMLPWSAFEVEGWGKIITTLAETNAGSAIESEFVVSPEILARYTPLEASLTTLFFEWLGGITLGLILMLINLATSRRLGIAVAMFFVLFDLLIVNILPYSTYQFSPASHGRITILDPQNTDAILPSFSEAIAVDVSLGILAIVLIAFIMRRSDIETRPLD